jgi:hypothetical protein
MRVAGKIVEVAQANDKTKGAISHNRSRLSGNTALDVIARRHERESEVEIEVILKR